MDLISPPYRLLLAYVAGAIAGTSFVTYLILGDFWSLFVLTLALFVLSGAIADRSEVRNERERLR